MRQRRSAEQVRVARRVRALLDEHRSASAGRADPVEWAIDNPYSRPHPLGAGPPAVREPPPVRKPRRVEAPPITDPVPIAEVPLVAEPLPSLSEPVAIAEVPPITEPVRTAEVQPLADPLPREPWAGAEPPPVADPWAALPDELLPAASGGEGVLGRHALLGKGAGVSAWLRRRGVRLDPGHRAGLAMGVVALIAALVAGWWVLSSRPHRVAVSSAPPAASVAPALVPPGSVGPGVSSSRTATSAVRLVVDVVGKVRHPGVYRLPDGARVGDALHAAGGITPGVDLSSLNLARKLSDGEQIAVGVPGAAPGVPAGDGSAASAAGPASGPIDLNTATVARLDSLPGVGPVLAQRIIDWRTAHGRFDSVDQLREVSGIGDSRFADLKSLVTV